MLKERGEQIKAEKWKKVTKIEKEIDELKSKHLGKLTRPISAFVTFESEEGFQRAVKFNSLCEKSDQGEIKEFDIFLPSTKRV